MADGTGAIAEAAGFLVPYGGRWHFADPNIWRAWCDAWIVLRNCPPPSFRASWYAGGPPKDAATLQWEAVRSAVAAAQRACEAWVDAQVRPNSDRPVTIEIYGRRDDAAAELRPVEGRVAAVLRLRKERGVLVWSGGGCIFYDLLCRDLVGVPPDQALFAYGPPKLMALDSLPPHSGRPAPPSGWSPGVTVTYGPMQPNRPAPFKNEAAAHLAPRPELLDAVRTGRLLVSHLGKDGRRSDLSPTQAGRLRSWAELENGLRFPLVRPRQILPAAQPRKHPGGAPVTTDWEGLTFSLALWLDTHGEPLPGERRAMLDFAREHFARIGKDAPGDGELNKRLVKAINWHRARSELKLGH